MSAAGTYVWDVGRNDVDTAFLLETNSCPKTISAPNGPESYHYLRNEAVYSLPASAFGQSVLCSVPFVRAAVMRCMFDAHDR